jgi:sec-independent protein translocase protein TatA
MPGGWEWLIIIGVLVLLFGAKRLPEMARSVGQSARVFKGEMKGLKDDEGRTTAQGNPAQGNPAQGSPAQGSPAQGPAQPGTRPAAPAEPAALPPADPASGTSEPARRDPVRPDTER